jgi:ribosomal protein L11 methyltransferase
LVLLFELAGPKTVHGFRALDMGCGSGLLSLAAAGLGCAQVLALDLNPLAVRTCRKNSLLNGLETSILSIQGRAEEWMDCPAEILLANIHYDVLQELVQDPGFDRKPWFILSGLLRSQAKEVLAVLKHKGARLIKIWDEDGTWFTVFGRN